MNVQRSLYGENSLGCLAQPSSQSRDFHKHPANVFTTEDTNECLRQCLDTFDHGVFVDEFPLLEQTDQLVATRAEFTVPFVHTCESVHKILVFDQSLLIRILAATKTTA